MLAKEAITHHCKKTAPYRRGKRVKMLQIKNYVRMITLKHR